MARDLLRLVLKAARLGFFLSGSLLLQTVRARLHRWTYRAVASPRNVVVIGGSFAGVQVATRLSDSLPSGYRVVVVERNSHFHYLFNFPRYTVIPGHEHTAFIPYDGIVKQAPHGALVVLHDEAAEVGADTIRLASGEELPYDYLVLATGSTQPSPSKLVATDKAGGCAELRQWQDKVDSARTIAVLGGGSVGVQISTDIKSYYPDKDVTLVHSRSQLLPRFGVRLHEHVLGVMKELGIHLRLGSRPEVLAGDDRETSLRFEGGETQLFDLIIPCTGQRPNSSLAATFLSTAISEATGEILTSQTLQVTDHANIFAIGDVAETRGPKMARAGYFQSETVVSNVLSLIQGKPATALYSPQDFEGAIKLQLGKARHVAYMGDGDDDILVPGSGGRDTLEVGTAWWRYNCKLRDCEKA